MHKRYTTLKSSFIKSKVEVIDLVSDMPLKAKQPSVVDLTNTEPEVIVLDDTISQSDRSLNELEVTVSDLSEGWIDLINCKESPKSDLFNLSRGKGKIDILKVNNSPCNTDQGVLFPERNNNKTCLSSLAKISKKRKRKMENTSCESKMVINVNKSGVRSIRRKSANQIVSSNEDSNLLHLIKNGTTQKCKKRLIDVSNSSISNNTPLIIADQSPKPLSDHVYTYYKNVDKVVKKLNKKKRKSVIKRNSNIKTKKKDYKAKDTSIIITKVNKIKPTNKKLQTKKYKKFKEKVKCEFVDTKNGGRRRVLKPCNNIYNPNPYEVDKEGFRPIVIDGSNVAVGHGRGKFSVKGLRICVDYFATRGHEHVKVFLPQFRQELFPEEMLKELQTKCDMVFTPSSDINGVRKTPYDDRFIVQYAVEFSGVIVSTDNYRDLLMENPRWQDTIKSRLLMFTWVDDFLMFPMDPLGRRGPSLEQFLRF